MNSLLQITPKEQSKNKAILIPDSAKKAELLAVVYRLILAAA